MASKQLERRNRIVNYIKCNPQLDKKSIVKYFVKEGMPRSTIYNIIDRYESNITMDRRTESGCKAKIFDLRKRYLLKQYFDHKDNVTITSGAKKFKVARSTIRYWLRKLKVKRY